MKSDGKALMTMPAVEPDGDEGGEVEADEATGGGEGELLGNAFDAAQEDDREGFIRSMRAAIRACLDSYGEE